MVLALATANAQPQDLYRPGQPATLNGAEDRARHAVQEEAEALASFRTAYIKAGKPAFLMMWHRELSDNVDSTREASATLASSGERARDNYERTIKVQWKEGSERAISLLPPARGAEFEAGFQQALLKAGAVLVDRNTAIRMSALRRVQGGAKESGLNFQTLEAGALAVYARYFIEIRFIPDARADGGSEPRVTVIDSGSGAIITDLVASDVYKGESAIRDKTVWVTTDQGFAKQVQPRLGQVEGRRVAAALLKILAKNLR